VAARPKADRADRADVSDERDTGTSPGDEHDGRWRHRGPQPRGFLR